MASFPLELRSRAKVGHVFGGAVVLGLGLFSGWIYLQSGFDDALSYGIVGLLLGPFVLLNGLLNGGDTVRADQAGVTHRYPTVFGPREVQVSWSAMRASEQDEQRRLRVLGIPVVNRTVTHLIITGPGRIELDSESFDASGFFQLRELLEERVGLKRLPPTGAGG